MLWSVPRLRQSWPRLLPPAVVVCLCAVLTCHFSVSQWHGLRVPSWDLAIFSQLAKDYAHASAPIVPIKGEGFNLLGDHFHPALIVLAPVWRVWPSPLALLIVQDVLLALSAWPVTAAACRRLGVGAGTAVGVAYGLSWGLQTAVGAQFHEVALAVPLLAWAGAAFLEQRWVACAAWCAPLVLVKEDLGLTVLMAGAAVAWRGWRGGQRRVTAVGAGLAAWGLVWFVVTVGVLIPALSSTGGWQYALGGNAGDGSTPATTSGLAVKAATVAMLVASAGVVGVASPWMSLVLPTLAWRFLSVKEAYWGWELWHYNAVLMPVVVTALLDVVSRWRSGSGRTSGTVAVVSETGAVVSETGAVVSESRSGEPGSTARTTRTAGETGGVLAQGGLAQDGLVQGGRAEHDHAGHTAPAQPRQSGAAGTTGRLAAAGAVLIAVITQVAAAPHMPVTGTDPYHDQSAARIAAAAEVIAKVPSGATVMTDLTLLAPLVPRATVYWVGSEHSTPMDYVIIDRYSGAWGGNPPADAAQWAQHTEGGTYELVYSREGFEVARRVGAEVSND